MIISQNLRFNIYSTIHLNAYYVPGTALGKYKEITMAFFSEKLTV